MTTPREKEKGPLRDGPKLIKAGAATDKTVEDVLLRINNQTKVTAIAVKQVVTSSSGMKSELPNACTEAENSCFLLLMNIVELESYADKQDSKNIKDQATLVANGGESLFKSIAELNKMAYSLLESNDDAHESEDIQKQQLIISEKINSVTKSTQHFHETLFDSEAEVGSEGTAPPVQSEADAKGLTLTDKKGKKGIAFIFQMAKRVAEQITKIPEIHEDCAPEVILEKATERESCISVLVELSRKFGRSRSVNDEQQRILDASSRARAAGTSLMAAQKSVIAKPGSVADTEELHQCAKAFSDELVHLLQTIISVKSTKIQSNRDVNIWDEDTEVGKNIIFDGKSVKAATLNQLVIRLTDPKTSDNNFVKAFISTFQSFVSADKLFTKLTHRYNVPRRKFREMDAAEWMKMWVMPTQVKVYNVFKTWIDNRFTDFNYGLVKRLNDFMDNALRKDGHSRYADRLRVQIKRNIDNLQQMSASVSGRKLPAGVDANQYLLGLSTDELAQQLTIMEHHIYKKIQPVELLNLAWSSAKLKHRAPNVLHMIDRFNVVSGWVTTVLLSVTGLKARAKMYNKLIQLGQACFDLNNYNTLLAIISGLNCAAVNRLKYTKEEASSKAKSSFEDLKAKMSSDASYKSIRDILHAATPPVLPYLGVFLTDLTFIEEGNPDMVGGLINFKKRLLVYNVLSEIQSYQTTSFNYTTDETAQACLDNITACDNDQLYKMSLLREGRNQQKHELEA